VSAMKTHNDPVVQDIAEPLRFKRFSNCFLKRFPKETTVLSALRRCVIRDRLREENSRVYSQ
jgi:hypothetical protein